MWWRYFKTGPQDFADGGSYPNSASFTSPYDPVTSAPYQYATGSLETEVSIPTGTETTSHHGYQTDDSEKLYESI